jgi:hypothetical protein
MDSALEHTHQVAAYEAVNQVLQSQIKHSKQAPEGGNSIELQMYESRQLQSLYLQELDHSNALRATNAEGIYGKFQFPLKRKDIQSQDVAKKQKRDEIIEYGDENELLSLYDDISSSNHS